MEWCPQATNSARGGLGCSHPLITSPESHFFSPLRWAHGPFLFDYPTTRPPPIPGWLSLNHWSSVSGSDAGASGDAAAAEAAFSAFTSEASLWSSAVAELSGLAGPISTLIIFDDGTINERGCETLVSSTSSPDSEINFCFIFIFEKKKKMNETSYSALKSTKKCTFFCDKLLE